MDFLIGIQEKIIAGDIRFFKKRIERTGFEIFGMKRNYRTPTRGSVKEDDVASRSMIFDKVEFDEFLDDLNSLFFGGDPFNVFFLKKGSFFK